MMPSCQSLRQPPFRSLPPWGCAAWSSSGTWDSRSAYTEIRPGYHLNKRHWNTITMDGTVPEEMVTDLLGDSYDLVVKSLPKARRP